MLFPIVCIDLSILKTCFQSGTNMHVKKKVSSQRLPYFIILRRKELLSEKRRLRKNNTLYSSPLAERFDVRLRNYKDH